MMGLFHFLASAARSIFFACCSWLGIFLNDQYVKGKAKKLTKDVETPKQAAVLGAGIMGGGIAYQSAWKGVPVVMKDINDKSLTLGMTEAAKLLNKQLERGKIDGLKLAGVISTIHPTLDYAGFDRVDIVVEAVVENPKVKKAITFRLGTSRLLTLRFGLFIRQAAMTF